MGLAVVLILRTFNFWVFLCSFVCLQELPEFGGLANVDESRAGYHSRKQFPCFFLPFATRPTRPKFLELAWPARFGLPHVTVYIFSSFLPLVLRAVRNM